MRDAVTYGTPLPAGTQSREDRPRSAVRGRALLAGSYRTGRGFLGLYAVRRGTAAAGSAERGLAREYTVYIDDTAGPPHGPRRTHILI